MNVTCPVEPEVIDNAPEHVKRFAAEYRLAREAERVVALVKRHFPTASVTFDVREVGDDGFEVLLVRVQSELKSETATERYFALLSEWSQEHVAARERVCLKVVAA